MFRGVLRCIVGMPYVKSAFQIVVHKKMLYPHVVRHLKGGWKIKQRTGLGYTKTESNYQTDHDFSTLSHDFLEIHQSSQRIGR